MNNFYTLQPGHWAGLIEAPVTRGWWGGSPVLVTGVAPLKTGQGQLGLDFINPLHPGGGRRRSIVAKVVQKAVSHVTCLYAEADVMRTAILAPPNFEWLRSCCPELLRRRPPPDPAFIIEGEFAGELSWEEYLTQVFGKEEDQVLAGTNRKSFEVKLGRMPKQRKLIYVNRELAPLDSVIASRGFRPQQMEDKWFIIHDNNRLLFRRSWTGILIYDVEANWRGDRLYLGQAYVNRMPSQYGETDDSYDAALLEYLIDAVLLGMPANFPVKTEEPSGALQAWSVAGSASLT